MSNAVLQVSGVSKRFGGLQALSDVGLTISAGHVYGLIGPNGAGKTTFFNVITGLYTPDAGSFMLGGAPYQPTAVHQVAKAGIARTFQNIRLFATMSALENVMVGEHSRMRASIFGAILRPPWVRREEQAVREKAAQTLDYVGLREAVFDELAINLSYGDQRRVEIARALASDPKLLLLDEPTAGMNPQESGRLVDFMRQLRDDRGITILLIEHDMQVVMGVSERVTVFDYGEKIAEGRPDEVARDERVVEAYLGTQSGS
jgi:branched-chain amino acid transport system ATP-binding protein